MEVPHFEINSHILFLASPGGWMHSRPWILAMSATGVLLAFERQINAWADAPAVLQGHTDSRRASRLTPRWQS